MVVLRRVFSTRQVGKNFNGADVYGLFANVVEFQRDFYATSYNFAAIESIIINSVAYASDAISLVIYLRAISQ